MKEDRRYYHVESVSKAGVRTETPAGDFVLLPAEEFLTPPKPGDCVYQEAGRYVVDETETQRRKAKLAARTQALFGKKKRDT